MHFAWVWMLVLLSPHFCSHPYWECAAEGLEESGTLPSRVCLQLDHIPCSTEGGPEGAVWWAADLTAHDCWKDGPRLHSLLVFFSLSQSQVTQPLSSFASSPNSSDPAVLANTLKSIYSFSMVWFSTSLWRCLQSQKAFTSPQPLQREEVVVWPWQQGEGQNRSPRTGGSEVLDPHGSFRPFVKCLLLTFKLTEAVVFSQHCSDPLPNHCWHSFQTRELIQLKSNLQGRKKEVEEDGFSVSSIYQGYCTLMSTKMKLLYRTGNKPLILGKRPWGNCFSWCWCSLRSL